MKKNDMQKYFYQKKWSLLDIVCIAIAVISIIIATFVWGGGPIGFPLFAVSIVVLICSKSAKTKDSEVDDKINRFITENEIKTDLKNIIETFDLNASPVVKGKDGKLRSSNYVISSFDFCSAHTKIAVHRIDLLTNDVKKETYLISNDETISLIEKTFKTPKGNKKANYLACDTFLCDIPVCTDDINASKIIEKICRS